MPSLRHTTAAIAAAAATGAALVVAGPAAATAPHGSAGLPPSATNAQSNLKNAQTVVEAYANGNGGHYPLSTGAALPKALPQDSDTSALRMVYYASHSRTADTYDLWDWSATNHTVYELQSRRGVTHFGSVKLKANPGKRDPAALTHNFSTTPWAF